MEYTVYILQSLQTRRYYVGQTEDLERRLKEHNSGESKSTKFGVPWNVVYKEVFMTRAEAMQRETQIKKRGVERFLRGVAQPG